LAANCSVFIIQLAASRIRILVSRLPADENCILLAAMQDKISKLITSLHAAGDQPNEICIQLVASRMQILQ
jgi:hypothetical protein